MNHSWIIHPVSIYLQSRFCHPAQGPESQHFVETPILGAKRAEIKTLPASSLYPITRAKIGYIGPQMCHWHASESHLPQCQGPYHQQLVGWPNSEISRNFLGILHFKRDTYGNSRAPLLGLSISVHQKESENVVIPSAAHHHGSGSMQSKSPTKFCRSQSTHKNPYESFWMLSCEHREFLKVSRFLVFSINISYLSQ